MAPRLALPVLALALAIAVAFGVPDAGDLATSYGAQSATAFALGLAAALALAGAGFVRAGGPVVALLSIASLAPAWVGWEGGPPLVRSVAALAAPFVAVLLAHVAIGRPPRVLYAAAALAAGLHLSFADPFTNPDCWSDCGANVVLVAAVGVLADASTVLSAVVAIVAAAWAVSRRSVAAIAAAAQAVYASALLLAAPESPSRTGFLALYDVRALALCALAAAIGWTAWRSWRTRAVVARLATGGSLRDALARTLRDPGLQVAYPHAAGWVDRSGAPVALDTRRELTRIERRGETVAVVAHRASLDALEEIGAAARLSVDNERLDATVLAQLEDLRRSQAAIVATGDAARRRLERDLHDGAQQRLLALSYELRLGGPRLAEAVREAQAALEELRQIAHGIYPAILAESGLRPALRGLAELAPIPVEFGEITDARLPAAVETAAYLVAAAGIEADAPHVTVSARRAGDELIVRVDGGGGPSVPEHLADRVAALGGRLHASDARLEARLPCG